MRRGLHMGMGFYGSYILIFLLLMFCIIIFLLLKNKPLPKPFIIKLIDILKEKYASGDISADEFIERKSIIEDVKYSSEYTSILLERYAKCEVTTREFLNIKNEIESNKVDRTIKDKLSNGELSLYEYKSEEEK